MVAQSRLTRAGLRTAFTGAAPRELRGFCRFCGVDHVCANDVDAAVFALDDLFVGAAAVDRALLDASRGKMVGVAVLDDASVLRAYSGDLGGKEDNPGFAPCLVRRADTQALQDETWAIVNSTTTTTAQKKAASQRLMKAMTAAVRLTSAGGVSRALPAIVGRDALPSGTGDCALPKLFDAANRRGLRVVGFAEAWWAGPGASVGGARRHGALQPPCAERCAPLIGHLLCGAQPSTTARASR